MTEACVVRVLTGGQAGAEATLPASGRATIGHEYWHDIVVRDATTRGCAVEIDVSPGDVARLSVLDGEAVLLGSTLRAGDTAVLPPYVPVALGATAFAFGEVTSERWAEATSIAVTAAPVAIAGDVSGEAAQPDASLWRSWREGRFGRMLRPRILLGIVAALIIAAVTAPAIEALQLGGTPADRTARALAAAGFRNVTVAQGANDEVLIAGYVATEADRQRVQSLVDGKGFRATVAIGTGEELARSAVDVARVNGVESRARTLGAGVVELSTIPLDDAGRARIDRLVRRDVPGLRRLIVRDDPTLAGSDDVKSISDATKRVSTVVSGDPAYIVTADGARYFPGAVMPSGHRLIAIEEQNVVLERNGRRIMLKF